MVEIRPEKSFPKWRFDFARYIFVAPVLRWTSYVSLFCIIPLCVFLVFTISVACHRLAGHNSVFLALVLLLSMLLMP